MRIGELARLVNTSVRAIRYYEQQGLLESKRSAGGQRVYDSAAMWRVETIRMLYSAGLSSSAIRELDECIGPRVLTDEQIDGLHAKLREIDERMAELDATRRHLMTIIESTEIVDGELTSVVLPGPVS